MDGKLMCSAINCVNNMNALCSANVIQVKGTLAKNSNETQCETFAEKGIGNALGNLTNMNVVGEVKQLFNKDEIAMSPTIKCEAVKCNYNQNKECTAANIQILGAHASTSEGTECETFVE